MNETESTTKDNTVQCVNCRHFRHYKCGSHNHYACVSEKDCKLDYLDSYVQRICEYFASNKQVQCINCRYCTIKGYHDYRCVVDGPGSQVELEYDDIFRFEECEDYKEYSLDELYYIDQMTDAVDYFLNNGEMTSMEVLDLMRKVELAVAHERCKK